MPLATMSDAVAEYARNAGQDDPARAWILSPFDTWHANPFYRGPAVRHPEDDSDAYDDDGDDLTPCLRGTGWWSATVCDCRLGALMFGDLDLPF